MSPPQTRYIYPNVFSVIVARFVVLGGCSNRPFSKKAQNLCDVTQYAYAECQVTKHIYTLAMNLVTLKCQYLNGNNSVNSASVMKFFTILE